MRNWLSVLITDAKSKKESDIPIAPSLYSLSNEMDKSLLAVRDINHKYIVVESMIEYQMIFNYKEQSYAYDVEDKKIKEEQIEVDGNNINVTQYELPDKSKENVAQFIYKDVFYTINTTMDENNFKELLKFLYFF